MDSTTAWASISEIVDSLLRGGVSVSFDTVQPTPSAVHGAKVALKLLREQGATLDQLPAVLATPWGSVVIWWRTAPQRRIEIISRDEAYEYRETPNGPTMRRFMSGPPSLE